LTAALSGLKKTNRSNHYKCRDHRDHDDQLVLIHADLHVGPSSYVVKLGIGFHALERGGMKSVLRRSRRLRVNGDLLNKYATMAVGTHLLSVVGMDVRGKYMKSNRVYTSEVVDTRAVRGPTAEAAVATRFVFSSESGSGARRRLREDCSSGSRRR
jgi:hypothetical protein